MRKSHEDVPLEPMKDGSKDTYVVNEIPKGMALYTKKNVLLVALLLIIFIVIFLIIIIVLASLLVKAKSKDEIPVVADDPPGGVPEKGGIKPINATHPSPPSGPWDNVRLPRSISPSHYDIRFNVDPNKDGFSGFEVISIDIKDDKIPYILIHSNGLDITKTSLTEKGLASVTINKTFHSQKNDFYVIKPNEMLSSGNYRLLLEFSGSYRTGLFGLFKGVYRGQDGKMAAFLSTQLEPLDARTVFPCFDEPALKATFKISMAYPKNMVGLSNNEVEKEEIKGEVKLTYYKATPKMSTYLVAIAVGHFEYKQLIASNGVKLRAFAQPGNTGQMDFSLRMSNETLIQMENTFGIKYPMKKLDFVAPPECYIAMENWGSFRFEEDGLLYKKDFSSEEIQQNLLIRWLIHEIVHLWFGNVVTTHWWNDIWLNEAVTDFFTYHDGSPKSLNSWKMNNLFIHTNLGDALELDGFVNSRPVVEPTPVPSIDTFDNIVYKKGSALLNMVKNLYPKKENFNEGIKKYLSDHAYGTAVMADMWNALQHTCPLKECPDIKESMNTWMTETNYPVLTVKKGDGGRYLVQQERFVYDKTAKVEKRLWRVRFSYFYNKDNRTVSKPDKHKSYDKWMIKDSQPVEEVEISWGGEGWIKGNRGQTGFYRVNYDNVTWASLAGQLLHWHSVFSEVDRYGLIDDAFNLVRGGRLGIKQALGLTQYLYNKDSPEKDYLPWLAVQKNFGYILSILPDHSHTAHNLKRYLAYQSNKFYNELGFKNTGDHNRKLLRMIIVGLQCNAGSRSCLGNMTAMFQQWKGNPLTNSITPALRKLVYFYGVHHGTPEDWEKILTQLKNNNIASEYQPLLMGLAGSRDKWTLYRALKLIENEMIVKEQYVKYLLDYVANHNPDGSSVTWTFLQLNWKKLRGKSAVSAMIKYLPTIARRFSTAYQLEQLENFVNENLGYRLLERPQRSINNRPIPRLLRKTIETVKLNIAWRKAHENDLEEWLKDFIKRKNLPQESSQSGFAEPA